MVKGKDKEEQKIVQLLKTAFRWISPPKREIQICQHILSILRSEYRYTIIIVIARQRSAASASTPTNTAIDDRLECN